MSVLIDSYSTEWIHYSFNKSFLDGQQGRIAKFLGNSSSLAFGEYRGEKAVVKPSHLQRIAQVVKACKAADSREVLFLAMTSKDLIVVFALALLGYDVNYVMHKLNLRCRVLRSHWKAIYFFLDALGVRALCFEKPHPLFKKFKLLDFNPYNAGLQPVLPAAAPRIFRRIAFIGRPDDGKEYEALEHIANTLGIEVIVFSDEKLGPRFKCRPHTYKIDDCDFIWGFYDPEHYQGIQSGLPYVALESGLRILTNRNIGFGAFIPHYSQYCVSCSDVDDVEMYLSTFYS